MHDLVSVESFDVEKTYEYILSIQVSLNGFSFCIKTPEENRILASKAIPLSISSNSVINHHFSEWVKTEALLHRPYKKIRMIVSGDFFTMIPEDYYDESQKKPITAFLFQRNHNFEIAENVIHSLKSKLLFTLPPGLNHTIQNEIGECEIAHPVKLIINNLPEIQKEYGLVLFLDVNNFYAVLFSQNTVLLANNFEMAHANDLVYFVLTILKQNALSINQTTIFLTSVFKQGNGFTEHLISVFPEIIFLDAEDDFNGNVQVIQFAHRCM